MYFYLPSQCEDRIPKHISDHYFSMRVKTGDLVTTVDLQGLKRDIEIITVDKKNRNIHFKTLVRSFSQAKSKRNILFQAMTDKNYIEKLVEIAPHANIDIIYLFQSDYSPKSQIQLERIEKILIRSCEQAQKLYKPIVKLLDENTFLEKIRELNPCVLDTSEQIYNSKKISDIDYSNIIVGPEGGWSSKEKLEFSKLDLRYVTLGDIIYPAWLAGYTWFTKHG